MRAGAAQDEGRLGLRPARDGREPDIAPLLPKYFFYATTGCKSEFSHLLSEALPQTDEA